MAIENKVDVQYMNEKIKWSNGDAKASLKRAGKWGLSAIACAGIVYLTQDSSWKILPAWGTGFSAYGIYENIANYFSSRKTAKQCKTALEEM